MKSYKYFIFIPVILFQVIATDAQNHQGWKEISRDKCEIQYLDTLDIDTNSNTISFYIKRVIPESDFKNRNHQLPDSSYTLYYADVEDPSLYIQSSVDFYSNGKVELSKGKTYVIGGDFLNYGLANIEFMEYYLIITGKTFIGSKVKTKTIEY